MQAIFLWLMVALFAVWTGNADMLVIFLIGLPLYLLGTIVWFFWQVRENIHPWRK